MNQAVARGGVLGNPGGNGTIAKAEMQLVSLKMLADGFSTPIESIHSLVERINAVSDNLQGQEAENGGVGRAMPPSDVNASLVHRLERQNEDLRLGGRTPRVRRRSAGAAHHLKFLARFPRRGSDKHFR